MVTFIIRNKKPMPGYIGLAFVEYGEYKTQAGAKSGMRKLKRLGVRGVKIFPKGQ